MSLKFKSHPWHGVSIGKEVPEVVTAFIEIVPTDTVKYEIDKESGYLKIDRPQKFSNIVPSLYGFIPQTYCDKRVAEHATRTTGKNVTKGDGDPLDICVLCERTITHGDIILKAKPIGGFRLIDKGEADDKIIAIMHGDVFYDAWNELTDVPDLIINRLKHYFLTYKNLPGQPIVCEIASIYGKAEAQQVIRLSQQDYGDWLAKK
ncbi:MAG TPA: inorganic pyrophosphatase [Bacteroidia bacterium]|jgi:inorganic pyrophosphatase|nr:inorganic pyrophosphatase [Bacteroidia bacterium]